MQRALIAALAVSALMPLQALAGSVTVRSGDTLSEIAARYGVSIRTLVRLNDLRDSDYLYEGQRLRIPGSSVTAGQATHTVVRGDNLSGIASRYRVRERDLITLNQLRQADHIEVGQRLRLPSNAVLPKPARPRQVPIKAEPNATRHTVARGQTLTQIARAYDVSVRDLVDLNSISNPNKVEVGTKLLLRRAPMTTKTPLPTQSVPETASPAVSLSTTAKSRTETPIKATKPEPAATATKPVSTKPVSKEPKAKPTKLVAKASNKPATSVAPKQTDWRQYGPLKVDWSNWQTMAGSEVAPTLNANGKPLYIAVNCGANKINVTGANGAWKTWNAPEKTYEKDLVKDRCRS